jgi:plastocyanin
MANGRSRSQGGVYAAIAAVAITVAIGVVGIAGANESAAEHTLTGQVNSGPWSPRNDITVQTGDSVKWTFLPGSFHNVETDPARPGAAWSLPGDDPEIDPVPNHPDVTYTFTAEGVYAFKCDAHPATMDGSITVQDEPVDPTPTPTPTTTPTATPNPQPGGGGGSTTTPPPKGGDDTVKPTLAKVRPTALRNAVRVRFTLSEPATVTVRVKRRGSRKVIKSARIQAKAGTRSVTLRSKALKKGRYTVEVQARDAFGNRSSVARKQLTLGR